MLPAIDLARIFEAVQERSAPNSQPGLPWMPHHWALPVTLHVQDEHQKIIGTEPGSFTERRDGTWPHQLDSRYRSGQISNWKLVRRSHPITAVGIVPV